MSDKSSAGQEGEVFGRDQRLMSEVTITGNKVGADRAFWAAIAHDEELFAIAVESVKSKLKPVKFTPIRKMEVTLDATLGDGKKVALVVVTPAGLGFKRGGRRKLVCRVAMLSGLSLCCRGVTNALTPCPVQLCGNESLVVADEPFEHGETLSLSVVNERNQSFWKVPASTDFFFRADQGLVFMIES